LKRLQLHELPSFNLYNRRPNSLYREFPHFPPDHKNPPVPLRNHCKSLETQRLEKSGATSWGNSRKVCGFPGLGTSSVTPTGSSAQVPSVFAGLCMGYSADIAQFEPWIADDPILSYTLAVVIGILDSIALMMIY
jgi:hypothetical protein